MPPAARQGDKTTHGGTIGPPLPPAAISVERVLIGTMPAAVVGSVHVCVLPEDLLLGPANVVLPPTSPARLTRPVLIGGLPAACAMDKTACSAQILLGDPTVLIGGPL
jgi:uncharacterized Zn-binding protein involved in type VI secretion